MDELHPPKSEALRALYWRSEILQVMYWLRGEGLGEVVDAPLLERFLGVDATSASATSTGSSSTATSSPLPAAATSCRSRGSPKARRSSR